MSRRLQALLVLALALISLACPPYRKQREGSGRKESYGVYRGRFESAEGVSRRFGVLLFAELPDRIHAEVHPPVGGAQIILDAGGGRVSITLTREKTAWVGPAREEVLERVLGIEIGLEELVQAILRNEPPSGSVRVSRTPVEREGLPESLELGSEGRTLRLKLRKRRRVAGSTESLATGAPPPGVRVRPLEELGEDLLFEVEEDAR